MKYYKPLINHSGFFYHDDIEHAGHKTHSHSLQNHSHATLSTTVHKYVHNMQVRVNVNYTHLRKHITNTHSQQQGILTTIHRMTA